MKIYTLSWNSKGEIVNSKLCGIMKKRPVLFHLKYADQPIQIIKEAPEHDAIIQIIKKQTFKKIKLRHKPDFVLLCFDNFLILISSSHILSETIDKNLFIDKFLRRFYTHGYPFIQIGDVDINSINEDTFSEKDSLDVVKLKLALMQSYS